jgi:hypothetical protein
MPNRHSLTVGSLFEDEMITDMKSYYEPKSKTYMHGTTGPGNYINHVSRVNSPSIPLGPPPSGTHSADSVELLLTAVQFLKNLVFTLVIIIAVLSFMLLKSNTGN